MALHIGSSEKLKITTESGILRMNIIIPSSTDAISYLRSSDGYVLKDLNNVYLTVKEDE